MYKIREVNAERAYAVHYNDFKKDCINLASLIEHLNVKRLFGVVRGGVLVASPLSYILNTELHPLYLDNSIPSLKPLEDDVIVDDIFDTGKTYFALKKRYPDVPFAFLYSKFTGLQTDVSRGVFVGRQINTKFYVFMPWELSIPMLKKGGEAPWCHPEDKLHARHMCKPCYLFNKSRTHYQKQDRKQIYEQHRVSYLKNTFDMTSLQYEEMASQQNNKCSICGVSPKQRLCIDHNHKTKQVRELLCRRCNLLVGHFEVNKNIVPKVIAYLSKHEGKIL